MNLVIDSGNTFAKAALFNGNNLVDWSQGKNDEWGFLFSLLADYHPVSVMVSDVADATDALKPALEKMGKVIYMHSGIPTPLKIQYKSPQTLGSDRLAAAVAAYGMFPGRHVLVIQAGTCITFEFVSEAAEYLGGAISPGLDMRFKALHTFTARLPLVKKREIDFLTGNTTNNAILSGVINGCIAEIDGIIDQYNQNYPDLAIVMGGGDTFFFDRKLKNRIFATENLVLRGLNDILNFNNADFEK